MRINLLDFPELQQNRGSVRISTSPLDPRTNKQTGLFPPVIVNRGDAGEFFVLSAACTHEDCIVRRLDKVSNRMVCPCHGSEYNADGTVVQGPAQQSLRAFKFTRIDQALTIEIPEVFYEMTVEALPASGRLKLSFLSFAFLKYEVYFRASIEAAPERVTFSVTADGPLDQTQIEVADDFAAVFVERPGRAGLFEIAMRTTKV